MRSRRPGVKISTDSVNFSRNDRRGVGRPLACASFTSTPGHRAWSGSRRPLLGRSTVRRGGRATTPIRICRVCESTCRCHDLSRHSTGGRMSTLRLASLVAVVAGLLIPDPAAAAKRAGSCSRPGPRRPHHPAQRPPRQGGARSRERSSPECRSPARFSSASATSTGGPAGRERRSGESYDSDHQVLTLRREFHS